MITDEKEKSEGGTKRRQKEQNSLFFVKYSPLTES
jgi:hypothetical protein